MAGKSRHNQDDIIIEALARGECHTAAVKLAGLFGDHDPSAVGGTTFPRQSREVSRIDAGLCSRETWRDHRKSREDAGRPPHEIDPAGSKATDASDVAVQSTFMATGMWQILD
jgi:hypothetical protein